MVPEPTVLSANGHLLGHLQNQFAILFAGLAQQSAKLTQKPRIFPRTAPSVFVSGLLLEQIWQCRRFFAVIKELIEWDLEGACYLFQRFDGWDSVTILDAGYVTAKQTCALFDVALREFLCLAHFAEAVANNHGGIVSSQCLEGKQGELRGAGLKNDLGFHSLLRAFRSFSRLTICSPFSQASLPRVRCPLVVLGEGYQEMGVRCRTKMKLESSSLAGLKPSSQNGATRNQDKPVTYITVTVEQYLLVTNNDTVLGPAAARTNKDCS